MSADRLSGHPLDLAVFRVALAVVLLLSGDVWAAPEQAAYLASLPREAWTVPWGAGWLIDWLGVTPALALAARTGMIFGAILGLLGLYARLGFAVVTVCGLYLLSLPHLLGSVVHYHHLLWFSALMVASPCDHALVFGRAGSNHPAPAYGLALRAVWALIAVIFFFPGVWKLVAGGADWLSGDTLRAHLYWKWLQSPALTAPRVDLVPGLLTAGAVAVSLFELSAPLLMLRRWSRGLFVLGALAFHALTAALMDIHFSSLWPLYVVFLPWSSWLRGDRPVASSAPSPVAVLTAGALLFGAGTAGALGLTQGWPFACYPTFHQHPGWLTPGLWVTVVDAEGVEEQIPMSAMADPSRRQAIWGEHWRLAGVGGPVSEAALIAYWAQIAERSEVAAVAAEAVEVRFYRARLSVRPEDRGAAPTHLTLLATIPLLNQ